MIQSEMVAYVITCLVGAATPGPGTLAVINSSITSGLRKTLPLMVGIIVGMAVIALVASLGLTVLMIKSKVAFYAVQYAGVAYIFYLGVMCIVNAKKSNLAEGGLEVNTKFTFKTGIIMSLLSPKVILFFTSLLPAFIGADSSNALQSLNLTLILLASTFAVHFVYANLGAYTSKFLKKEVKKIELATGVFFVAIALFILLNS